MSRPSTVVLAVVLVAALGGCKARPLTQEVDVQFAPDATESQKDAVRDACGSLPHVSATSKASLVGPDKRRDAVRFDVTHASDREKAALYQCLSGRPGVLGAGQPEDE